MTLLFFGLEANAPAGRRLLWTHQLPDGVKDDAELGVVLSLQLLQLPGQVLVGPQQLADPDKGIHNLDIDLDRSFAVQDAGKHGHTLLSESIRGEAATTPLS